MSKLVEGILLAILGAVVAVPITIYLSDPVNDLLARIFGRLQTEKKRRLFGYWTATYNRLDADGKDLPPTVETLSFLQIGDRVVGRKVNLTTLRTDRAYRLKGKLRDRYVTGEWFDPRANAFYHGAFQFVMDDGGELITGRWLGYSSNKLNIRYGDWNLTRGRG